MWSQVPQIMSQLYYMNWENNCHQDPLGIGFINFVHWPSCELSIHSCISLGKLYKLILDIWTVRH